MAEIAMSFDFGMTKIGIAVGQKITGSATPIGIVKARDGIPDWQQIEAYLKEWKPKHLVVGLPLNMDGTESDMANAATRFSNRLKGRFGIETHLVDERLSTFEAKQLTDDEQVDAHAAKLILETWLRDYSADS